MANISSAKGTLTLVGNWAPEDIELANQVVRAWEFHGEFGMSLSGTLSPENMSGEFRGTGRPLHQRRQEAGLRAERIPKRKGMGEAAAGGQRRFDQVRRPRRRCGD